MKRSELKQLIKETINESSTLRSVKVEFDNGDSLTTSMGASLTDEEIYDYYKKGKSFNLGQGEKDKMARVKKVTILK